MIEQLLPLSGERLGRAANASWDYIYEPDAQGGARPGAARATSRRSIYQAVAENMASEQSARMVAMKAASDNAANADRRAAR